jgi:hypothetical protein
MKVPIIFDDNVVEVAGDEYNDSNLMNLADFSPVIDSSFSNPEHHHLLKDDEKAYKKFIFKCESLIRTSHELRSYLHYLRSEMDMTRCKIMKNISHEDSSVELHHYPFTLYDVVDIVFTNRVSNLRPISTLAICKEVVSLHFKGLIGLVPLGKTVHELAHSGAVFINLKHVFGDYKLFMQTYNAGLTGEHIEDIRKLITLSNNPDTETVNSGMLTLQRSVWHEGSKTLADAVNNQHILPFMVDTPEEDTENDNV